MPRKIQLKPCACGCGKLTNSLWAQGHDRKLEAAMIRDMEAAGHPNGLLAIRALVEAHLGREVRP